MKNRLKEYREKLGLSQENLAKELNISRQTIISIEKEKYNPSLQLAFMMAKKFKCSIEELFFYEENKNEN